MAVTLKDVAVAAHVTPTVVSHVLHRKSSSVRVSEATAERVRKAAEQLGYQVNVLARNFRNRQTKTVGVLNGQGLERPIFRHGPRYFATLMDGIVDGAFRHDYSVTLCPRLLGEHPQESIFDGRFDGLLLYSITPTEATLAALRACPVPLIVIHAHPQQFADRYPTVICDNAQGVGLALDHLYDLGHRRIAFAIEGDALNVESLERLQGFRIHMARLGLDVKEEDILDVRRGRFQLHAYFEAGPAHTAIIVHADGLASEILRAAPTYGVRIPEALSVVGFDSTDFCEEMKPSLTSISQPLLQIGERAVELLIQRIAGNPVDPLELVLPCGLDIRGSTTTA